MYNHPHLTPLPAHHEIGRLRPTRVDYRETHRSLQRTPIRNNEPLCALGADAERLQHRARHPGVLATGIDERVLDRSGFATLFGVLHENGRSKGTRLSHGSHNLAEDTMSLLRAWA